MATEPELKAIIKKEREGKWIEYHDPFKIRAANVWEIWTSTSENKKDKYDWTPQTRWWLEDKNGSKLYFAYFADLAAHLTANVNDTKGEIEPDSLTIGQLISGLKLSQLCGVLGVIGAAIIGSFFLGVASPHFWSH